MDWSGSSATRPNTLLACAALRPSRATYFFELLKSPEKRLITNYDGTIVNYSVNLTRFQGSVHPPHMKGY